MSSYQNRPGGPAGASEEQMRRAAERVTLACRALSSAVNELRVAYARDKAVVVEDAARMAEAETERVCEMAEEVASLASNLNGWPGFAHAGGRHGS